jgi:hypothetical protein
MDKLAKRRQCLPPIEGALVRVISICYAMREVRSGTGAAQETPA